MSDIFATDVTSEIFVEQTEEEIVVNFNEGLVINNIIGGDGKKLLIDYVTTVPVNEFDPVTADGKICDSNNIAHMGKLIGLANESIGANFGSSAISEGQIQNSNWAWNAGDIIYLNGTSLSKIPPSANSNVYSQVVAVAVKTDTINLKIQQSFQF